MNKEYIIIIKLLREGVPLKEIILYLLILNSTNGEGSCIVDEEGMSNKLNVKKTTDIKRYIADLIDRGWLKYKNHKPGKLERKIEVTALI
ncbi:MAG: helix-turn-helix domain-containing protein [Elusimicrobiota bacterium]